MRDDDDGGLQWWQEVGQWYQDEEYEAWLDALEEQRKAEDET